MANTVTVSLHADREYVNALSVLARRKGKRMGVLVREALQDKYGAELEEILSFFANSDVSKHQMIDTKSNGRKKRTQKVLP